MRCTPSRRGIFDADFLDKLLDEPNRLRSNLGVNALWQASLLELSLQERAPRRALHALFALPLSGGEATKTGSSS